MTDKQHEALRIASDFESFGIDHKPDGWPAIQQRELTNAAIMLRHQHEEIERLTACLKWEQNRAERIGTHGPGCEKWGSSHYECLLRSVERKDALLRQALEAINNAHGDGLDNEVKLMNVYTAIKQEISQ